GQRAGGGGVALPLAPVLDASRVGGDDAAGVRADATWRRLGATFLALRGAPSEHAGDTAGGTLARLRFAPLDAGALRLGATWTRDLAAAIAPTTSVLHRDLVGF